MLNAGGYGTGARWFLDAAVEHDDAQLAEWCLSHGANPNSAPGPQRRNRQRSLYDEAMFRGHVVVAELLVRYGATRSSMVLSPMQRLIAACLRGDQAAIRDAIATHPEFLTSHEALFAARVTTAGARLSCCSIRACHQTSKAPRASARSTSRRMTMPSTSASS